METRLQDETSLAIPALYIQYNFLANDSGYAEHAKMISARTVYKYSVMYIKWDVI